MPVINDCDEAAYDMGSKQFARGIWWLVKAGGEIIGGGGTTPEYIREAKSVLDTNAL